MYLCKQAAYYNANANTSFDDVLDAFSLIELNSNCSELKDILDASFAYVITLFYSTPSITSRRMQIAISYNSIPVKMAIRVYSSNGWTSWNIPGYKAINNTDYTTQRVRNIAVGTTVPSTLSNGDIFFVYGS